jgi:hypothetical protein
MPISFWQTVGLFGAIVLVFEALWSALARIARLSYPKGAWVGLLVYAGAAFYAARHYTFGLAVDAAVLTAAIQATLGWGIAALIGPGRPAGDFSAGKAVLTVAFVVSGGAVCGVLGAALQRLTHP